MNHLTQQFIDEMKERLTEEKEKLEIELADLQAHTELGSDLDSDVQEIQMDEVNRDIAARLKEDLRKTEAALEKIANGTYGLDDDGNEISEDRLRALPWADKAI